jgi:glycosyltransferase involved in cell wall biosynthesis
MSDAPAGKTGSSRRWIVSQIGAREHYAAPRAFQRRGELRLLYTDSWCRLGRGLLSRAPSQAVRAFAGRCHSEVPSRMVVSFTIASQRDRSALRRGTSTEDVFLNHRTLGERFAHRVARDLSRRELDPSRDAFFGYDTGCLETLELLNTRGVPSVVDQIDPGPVEEQIVFEESQKWPGWESVPGRIPAAYYERLAREWELASRVLVNSPWSRDALMQRGVPPGKIIVVPLAYEPDGHEPPPRREGDFRGRPLSVLWLGSVNLRKGIQYLIDAAKRLRGEHVEFIVAGPVHVSEQAVATAPPNMKFIGRVTRDRAAEVYRAADVFALPTLSDGFAITQLEAMSHGLPVIATPRCGEVVTPGVDGLIVPPYDGAALAEAIATLSADRARVAAMSAKAFEKSRQFTLARFAERIDAAMDELKHLSKEAR